MAVVLFKTKNRGKPPSLGNQKAQKIGLIIVIKHPKTGAEQIVNQLLSFRAMLPINVMLFE
jgi:hypothetical protein